MIGTGVGGLDTVGERLVPMTDAGKVRRLGSTIVEQVMGSGVSARVSGLLALGNQVTTNSSACSTGTEAIVEGAIRIRQGLAERMLCGGSEGDEPLHLGRVRRDARALAPLQRRAREGVAADERQRGRLRPGRGRRRPAPREPRVRVEARRPHPRRAARRRPQLRRPPRRRQHDRPQPGERAPLHPAPPSPTPASSRGEVDAINGHLTATGADPNEVEAWAARPRARPRATCRRSPRRSR